MRHLQISRSTCHDLNYPSFYQLTIDENRQSRNLPFDLRSTLILLLLILILFQVLPYFRLLKR